MAVPHRTIAGSLGALIISTTLVVGGAAIAGRRSEPDRPPGTSVGPRRVGDYGGAGSRGDEGEARPEHDGSDCAIPLRRRTGGWFCSSGK